MKLLPLLACLTLSAPLAAQDTRGARDAAALAGDWKLIAFVHTDSAGGRTDVWGPAPQGRLHYGATGLMSLQMYDARRPPLGVADFRQATAEAARGAFLKMSTYFGRWTVDPAAGTVSHHVEAAWVPEWIGRAIVRGYRFRSPDTLELRVITNVEGRPSPTGQLVLWERMGAGGK